jgi:hypothetical protein
MNAGFDRASSLERAATVASRQLALKRLEAAEQAGRRHGDQLRGRQARRDLSDAVIALRPVETQVDRHLRTCSAWDARRSGGDWRRHYYWHDRRSVGFDHSTEEGLANA